MKKHFLFVGAAILLFSASCVQKPNLTLSGLNPEAYLATVNNAQTSLYKLKNGNGMEVCVTNFGGRIVSVMVPDKNGEMKDVVLGFDSIADYINIPSDFGASIGRYANRINQGRLVWTVIQFNCRKTTLDTACMEVPRDGNIKCMMPNRLMAQLWN